MGFSPICAIHKQVAFVTRPLPFSDIYIGLKGATRHIVHAPFQPCWQSVGSVTFFATATVETKHSGFLVTQT